MGADLATRWCEMSQDHRSDDTAAETAWRTALNLAGHDRQTAAALARNAELAVIRRLIAATLPGGLAEYWQLVDQELRS